ncbi:MAG: CcmD family protein [Chitinophagaceae bacterium]|nr:CcmD family protein [Chitinophagaceae bacterium]
MNRLKKILCFMLLMFTTFALNAQELLTEEARRAQRNEQSIYIVLIVVLTLMLGLFVYLFYLDRKISKLEKEG